MTESLWGREGEEQKGEIRLSTATFTEPIIPCQSRIALSSYTWGSCSVPGHQKPLLFSKKSILPLNVDIYSLPLAGLRVTTFSENSTTQNLHKMCHITNKVTLREHLLTVGFSIALHIPTQTHPIYTLCL